ncbi:MAG: hypothetical protein QM736_14195 [Vicinamibacterales bacterium]
MPSMWVEEMNFDKVQRRLIQKRKVYNDTPMGIVGIAPEYAEAAVRRPARSQSADAAPQSRRTDQAPLLQRVRSDEFVLSGGIYENPNRPEERLRPAGHAAHCWRRPAGRTATRRGAW